MPCAPAAVPGAQGGQEPGVPALPGRGGGDGEVAQPADHRPQQVARPRPRLRPSGAAAGVAGRPACWPSALPLSATSRRAEGCALRRPYSNVADILAVNIGALMLDVVPGRVLKLLRRPLTCVPSKCCLLAVGAVSAGPGALHSQWWRGPTAVWRGPGVDRVRRAPEPGHAGHHRQGARAAPRSAVRLLCPARRAFPYVKATGLVAAPGCLPSLPCLWRAVPRRSAAWRRNGVRAFVESAARSAQQCREALTAWAAGPAGAAHRGPVLAEGHRPVPPVH